MSAIFLSKWALKTIKQYKVWPWSSLENGKGWELLECVVDVTAGVLMLTAVIEVVGYGEQSLQLQVF